MPRVIFKCPYIKGGARRAVHLKNYVGYIAKREGVERIAPDTARSPATEKQQAMVAELAREFPSSRETSEYEDYRAAPTRANVSAFITRAIEDNIDELFRQKKYVDYIAKRPRVQRVGAHGLFSGMDQTPVLSQVAETVAQHPGNMWLTIISLKREDAERLGYDNAENWRALLSGFAPTLAQAMKIPLEQFRWYAAYHDEGHHPHVHMVCYSADGKSGFLTKAGIAEIKSGLAREIFRQELHEIYERQSQRRDELTQESREALREVIAEMTMGAPENRRIEQLMKHLSQHLRDTKGKRQYGYLKASLKAVVDEIVDELAKDPRVAEAYALWYEQREEVLRTYRDDLPERAPLSQQKEFRTIKNAIIREAEHLKLSAMEHRRTHSTEHGHETSHSEHREAYASQSAAQAATNLLYHLALLFQQSAASPKQTNSIRIDSKRRKKLREKRLTQGHKLDDHEGGMQQRMGR
jgi:hypothetical protein